MFSMPETIRRSFGRSPSMGRCSILGQGDVHRFGILSLAVVATLDIPNCFWRFCKRKVSISSSKNAVTGLWVHVVMCLRPSVVLCFLPIFSLEIYASDLQIPQTAPICSAGAAWWWKSLWPDSGGLAGPLASPSLRFLGGSVGIVVTFLRGCCEQEATLIVTHGNPGKTTLRRESPVMIEDDWLFWFLSI